MDFCISERDGPARIGRLTIEKNEVKTPAILFIQTPSHKAPGFADLVLTNTAVRTTKPVISIGDSFFSVRGKNKPQSFVLDEYLLYPKDVPEELHRYSVRRNSKTSDWSVVPPNTHVISDVVEGNKAAVFVVGDAAQLLTQQTHFVGFITALRKQIGYERLIYTPSIGEPASIALFSFIGIDLFDSFSAIMAAREEMFLFPTGSYAKSELREIPCTCPACSAHTSGEDMGYDEILAHNYYSLSTEVKQVRNAIHSGSLRELVETRVRASPHLAALLRLMDLTQYQYLEERVPVVRKRALVATTKEALTRPEIKRFQERLVQRYEKPACARILLLLPCSAKKPYSFSRSHKLFRERINGIDNPYVIHEVILTSPLGIVPRELELSYPASSYDIAVTGYWDEDEKKMIRMLLEEYLRKNKYDTVIMHLPHALQEFVRDILENPVSTCVDIPTSLVSLDLLSDVLRKTARIYDPVGYQQRAYENVRSLACYQFGPALADQLLNGCSIRGKYPYQRLLRDDRQLGMITQERGYISLTLNGAELLSTAGTYWVEIDTDFILKGSVFAPGIKDADASIRVGDEVIVKRSGAVVGVGVALMNGIEMKESRHGEAVNVRHHC